MKSIKLQPQTTNVHVVDTKDPTLTTEDDVKLKVQFVGICGTDKEEVSGGRSKAPDREKELIIGHEMIGIVDEAGKNVTHFKKGDPVVCMVRRPCTICTFCKMDRQDFCSSGQYKERGIKELHGFQSDFIVDHQKYMIKVPKEIQKEGVLTEPTSIIEKAIDEIGLLQTARLAQPYDFKGKTAFVAGLGPVGLLGAVALALRGCKVYGMDVVDDNHPKAKILNTLGGTYINGKQLNYQEFTKTHDEMDIILEAAGIAVVDFNLIYLLGLNGAYSLTGVTAENRELNLDGGTLMKQIVMKNQLLIGSVNAAKKHFQTAIEDLNKANQKWPGILEQIITHSIKPEEFPNFMQQKSDDIKVVVDWS